MGEVLEKKVLFDGGENPKKWEAHGVPKGIVPDQYIERCDMGAVNLSIYSMGHYKGCFNCQKKKVCQDSGVYAGEQAEP